ncbi:hypothetical protein [Nocardia sp. NPDC005366]|uniref:hypothetical protein n=1 Tax=Nocardia sp. NPDC005366 TaxID=3156878 RepID=UPI0033AD9825
MCRGISIGRAHCCFAPAVRNGIPVIETDVYAEMPEDLARAIEVKDGMLVHRESPSPNHVSVAREIEAALRAAVRDQPPRA